MTDRPSLAAALTVFLSSVVLMSLSSIAVALSGRLGPGSYASLALVEGISFALPATLYYVLNAGALPALRINRLDAVTSLLIILSAAASVLALNWLTTYWMYLLSALGLELNSGNSAVPRTVRELWFALAAMAVVTSMAEELLFRGMLLPALEPLGYTPAVLVSGAMFALLHGRLEALPAHLLLGMLLSLLVLTTGSLLSAVLYHSVYNGVITLLSFTAFRGVEPQAAVVLPTLEECLQALPMVALLALVWVAAARAALWRGGERRADFLPRAERRRCTPREKMLLAACGAVLVFMNGYALWNMLPGVGL